MHSADAVLLAAADAVANRTLDLMGMAPMAQAIEFRQVASIGSTVERDLRLGLEEAPSSFSHTVVVPAVSDICSLSEPHFPNDFSRIDGGRSRSTNLLRLNDNFSSSKPPL